MKLGSGVFFSLFEGSSEANQSPKLISFNLEDTLPPPPCCTHHWYFFTLFEGSSEASQSPRLINFYLKDPLPPPPPSVVLIIGIFSHCLRVVVKQANPLG